MAIDLGSLKPAKGARRPRKRVGRGIGSGTGKTAGRGQKGTGARAGSGVKPGFEGGQMPLQRRLPKRGFKNPSRVPTEIVALGRLDRYDAGSVVDRESLVQAGLVRGAARVKILSDGEITKALTIRVDAVSAKAREKIEAAGGSVEVPAG